MLLFLPLKEKNPPWIYAPTMPHFTFFVFSARFLEIFKEYYCYIHYFQFYSPILLSAF